MTEEQQGLASDRPIKLFLIDDDAIFRLGLRTILDDEGFAELQVVASDSLAAALDRLTEQVPDLLAIDPGSGSSSSQGWQLCQQIRSRYPDLPIFLLSADLDPQQFTAAQQAGFKGYCPKGTPIETLVRALRRVASGETYWKSPAIAPSRTSLPRLQPLRRRTWLFQQCQSGLGQIEEGLEKVNRELQKSQLSLFDWLFWSGRRRELLATRWLVNQILPVEVVVVAGGFNSAPLEPAPLSNPPYPAFSGIAPQQSPISPGVLDNMLAKIQSGLDNLTGIPLEIDILKTPKKQELLYLVLNQLSKVLEELRFLKVTQEQLSERLDIILQDLWQFSCLDFLRKNFIAKTRINESEVFKILIKESAIIKTEVLDKIPWRLDLFAHWLFARELLIYGVDYRNESPEALTREEILLQNLMIQIANGVMQVILNDFSDLEIIQQSLSDSQFQSSRAIARFRNDLSWRYRLENFFEEPKNIFEDRYRLFVINGNSIKTIFIKASRKQELEQLRGIRWTVTIALEARDAIAPRLRALVDWVGRGLVYLLTEVIGKGIGLIGRGIIQGIGNTLQDSRYRRNSEQGK